MPAARSGRYASYESNIDLFEVRIKLAVLKLSAPPSPPHGVSGAHVQCASYSSYNGGAAASCSPCASCSWGVLVLVFLRPFLPVPLESPRPGGCCWGRRILGKRGPAPVAAAGRREQLLQRGSASLRSAPPSLSAGAGAASSRHGAHGVLERAAVVMLLAQRAP